MVIRDASEPGQGTMNGNSEEGMVSIVVELWHFLKARKKYWLLPIILMSVVFGGLVVLTSGSAVAPFVYTLF